MYPTAMHAELAASRQRDLIAAAADHDLARQARRAMRRTATVPPVPRTLARARARKATQPAHS